jgi:hypothetical protein
LLKTRVAISELDHPSIRRCFFHVVDHQDIHRAFDRFQLQPELSYRGKY